MRRSLTRSTAVLIAAAWLAQGCGPATSSQAAATANQPSGTAPSAEPTSTPVQLSGSLEFPSHFWADNAKWQIKHRDLFEEQFPDVSVEAAPVPFPDYHNKVYTDMAAGQAPDIVVPYDPQIGQWAREGLLEPLDTCLTNHGIDTADLIPPQQVAQIDGSTYGLLYYSNPRVLVYNTALFEGANLEAPTDLDSLQQAIDTLRDPAIQQFGFATVTGTDSPAATYLDIMPIVAGFGGAFVKDGMPTASSPETIAALEFLKKNVSDGAFPQGATQASYREAFIAGKVGSVAIGGFIVGTALNSNPAVGEVLDAVPLPFPSGDTVAVNVFLAIPAASDNKEAACEYIALSLDPTIQQEAAAGVTAIPATGTVNEAYLDEKPFFKAVVDAAQVAVSYAPEGAEEHMADVSQIVTDVYQELLTTDMTAAEAGAKMQVEIEAIIN